MTFLEFFSLELECSTSDFNIISLSPGLYHPQGEWGSSSGRQVFAIVVFTFENCLYSFSKYMLLFLVKFFRGRGRGGGNEESLSRQKTLVWLKAEGYAQLHMLYTQPERTKLEAWADLISHGNHICFIFQLSCDNITIKVEWFVIA